jgi:hypothetical protein
MITTFIHSLQSERIKMRRSAAFWLVVAGALFIPSILTILQIFYPEKFSPMVMQGDYWRSLYKHSWETMAILLLPTGVILSTSLITQMEYKNNTWKQVFASPQSLSTIFLSKLTITLLMMLAFFIFFTLGILISAYLPPLLNGTNAFPSAEIPIDIFVWGTMKFFVACLPIVAIQYFISMRFKNFLVSVGVGLAMIVASIFALQWKYGYTFPYCYAALQFFEVTGMPRHPANISIMYWSVGYFLFFTLVHYITYISRKERG